MQINHLTRAYRYNGIDLPVPPHLADDPAPYVPTMPRSTRRFSMPRPSMSAYRAQRMSPNIAALSAQRADNAPPQKRADPGRSPQDAPRMDRTRRWRHNWLQPARLQQSGSSPPCADYPRPERRHERNPRTASAAIRPAARAPRLTSRGDRSRSRVTFRPSSTTRSRRITS